MTLPPTTAGHSSRCWPVTVDPVYLCWLWQAELDAQGYAVLDGKTAAHRRVYEQERGIIPKGLMLDHWCRRRHCVNPMHLEAVKQGLNERRKLWRYRVRMKVCQFGHDLYLNGRRTPEGGKVCLVCG